MTNEEKILQVLGEISSHLTKHDEMFGAINTRLDKMDTRLDGVDSRLDKLEENITCMRLEIENSIKPNIQKLTDGYALLRETMATREQVEDLREDLETEKVTLEILATKRLR